MSRYIDADALIESIKNTADLGGWIGEALYQIKQVAIKYIDSAPSIDIEPKRGEWIFKTVFPNDKSEFPMGYLVCSVCGSHHSNSTPCNYCDNCGADMREREGE